MDDKALNAAVTKHDLVISLIPYTFHATVTKFTIRNKKDVVTTSYVSLTMFGLNAEVKKAGILEVNETDRDPGLIIFTLSRPLTRFMSR